MVKFPQRIRGESNLRSLDAYCALQPQILLYFGNYVIQLRILNTPFQYLVRVTWYYVSSYRSHKNTSKPLDLLPLHQEEAALAIR